MNKFTKILSMILAFAMVFSMTACGGSEAAPETEATSGETGSYTVSVKSAGGMILEGVDIYIYADNTLADLKQYGETNADGIATFTMDKSDSYAVVVSGTPKGYQVDTSYAFSGNTCNISLTSSVIKGENLAGATLGLGDVMYDFSVVTPDGQTVTLSEMLEEKDMVLMNFWYTTCTWCVKEFPYMEEAYQQYSDKIGIIAVNPFEEDPAISSFQAQYGLSFPMAKCPSSWSAAFNISGYPTSIIIDRYGVISLIEAGGVTSIRPFINLFEHFSAENYEQKLFNALSELVTNVKPTYEMDTPENVAAALNNGEIPVSYRAEEGEDAEYCWPFIQAEKLGESCFKASNQEIDDSFAILYVDAELKAGQAIGFDYLVSSERAADVLHVIVDNEPIYAISGVDEEETWKNCYPWVALEDGTYEIAVCYIKDESTHEGDDTAYIKNFRILESTEVDAPSYIPRYAAVSEDGFEFDYVDVVLNEKDGYYHVGTENGPLLLAVMMDYTLFSEENTLWNLAYDGTITLDGHNYYEDLEQYFNYASNSSLNGICTVNEELAELLKIVAQVAGFDGDENEWLKMCKYFEAYGTSEGQLVDPIKGLATFSAHTATKGKGVESNYFYYDHPILPRGQLAEFVPTVSGVYRITSRNESQDGVDAWIFDADREELYVYEQSERLFNDNKNVSMLYYMEAGTPYYIDIAFWDVYEVGYIYYDIEYVGPTMKLFRTCSPGYFTYDTDATGEAMYHLIAGGVDVILGEDGYYHEDLGLDANGKQQYGSIIYADFTGITGVFGTPIATVDAYNADGTLQKDADGNNVKIKGMIDMGGFDFTRTEDDLYILSFLNKYEGDVEATDAYLHELWGADYDSYAEIYQLEDIYEGKYHGTGEDYTEEMKTYLDDIITSGGEEIKGCVPVTERLAELLQLLLNKYTFENVDHSWTKICYYYQNLGPNG